MFRPTTWNTIAPLIAGVILIMVGLSAFYGFQYLQYLGTTLIVIIGILIMLWQYRSRRKDEYTLKKFGE